MSNQIDTDAKVIAGDDYGFGHPAVVRLTNTVMLTGHINQSDELEIHKSTDDGLNWTLKKTLSNATGGGTFQLIAMTSSKAALVYRKNGNEFEVWVSIDSGETWTNKLDITIGVDSNDKAVLLYNVTLGRLYIFSHMDVDNGWIYNKYSDNDGDNWTGNQQGAFAAADGVDGDINLINNYVYFLAIASGYHKLYWFSSTGAFLSSFILHSTYSKYDLHIALDSQGNRYAVYVQDTTGTEYLYVDRNELGPTGRIQLFSPGGTNIIVKGSTSIGIDEEDNVYVFYTKTSDEKTYYRKYDAGISIWESEAELIGIANNRINTEKHILGGSNQLHFVYYQQP